MQCKHIVVFHLDSAILQSYSSGHLFMSHLGLAHVVLVKTSDILNCFDIIPTNDPYTTLEQSCGNNSENELGSLPFKADKLYSIAACT